MGDSTYVLYHTNFFIEPERFLQLLLGYLRRWNTATMQLITVSRIGKVNTVQWDFYGYSGCQGFMGLILVHHKTKNTENIP